MSGFEVVGVLLGVFPLIISSLEHYGEGLRAIERWRQFDRELRSLLRVLGNEQDIFLNTLEELLSGVIGPEEVQKVMTHPQRLCDPILRAKVQRRLQRSQHSYLETVRSMAEALEEVRQRLGMGSDGQVRTLVLALHFATSQSLCRETCGTLNGMLHKARHSQTTCRTRSMNLGTRQTAGS